MIWTQNVEIVKIFFDLFTSEFCTKEYAEKYSNILLRNLRISFFKNH